MLFILVGLSSKYFLFKHYHSIILLVTSYEFEYLVIINQLFLESLIVIHILFQCKENTFQFLLYLNIKKNPTNLWLQVIILIYGKIVNSSIYG